MDNDNKLSRSRRTVLLHGHMFKNAGTSVDKILYQNFGLKFVDHRNDEEMRKGKQPYLDQYLRTNKSVKALSSHRLPLPLSKKSDIDYQVIILLRNPIVRAGSVYRFENRQEATTPGALAAKKYNFPDYIRWRLEERPVTIANFFTNYCTSAIKDKLTNKERLEYALRAFENLLLVGIVERFDESMRLLKKKLEVYDIDLRLDSVWENVTDNAKEAASVKMDKIQKKLGGQLYNRLLEANTEDLVLYNRALAEFSKETIALKKRR